MAVRSAVGVGSAVGCSVGTGEGVGVALAGMAVAADWACPEQAANKVAERSKINIDLSFHVVVAPWSNDTDGTERSSSTR